MKSLILFISIISFITGCAAKTQNENVVAIVNGEKITMSTLEAKIDELPEYYQAAASKHKKEILNDLIVEKLLIDEAMKRKLHKDTEVKELVDRAQKKILVAKLLDIETAPKKPISDDDIEQFYAENKERYLIPGRVKASHILLSTEEEAQQVLEKINLGLDFAEMAKIHSKDLTKDRGGDLGYFKKGQMIPEFEEACFKLEPGQMSGIVKTRFGYHIIKVTDKQSAEYKQLSEVREKVRAALLDQAKQEQFEGFVQSLKDKAKIELKDEKLSEEATEKDTLPEEPTS